MKVSRALHSNSARTDWKMSWCVTISPWCFLHQVSGSRCPWSPLWTEPFPWSSLCGTRSSWRHRLQHTWIISLIVIHIHGHRLTRSSCQVKNKLILRSYILLYACRVETACPSSPGLCLMLSLEPHFDVTLLTSTFLLSICTCQMSHKPF